MKTKKITLQKLNYSKITIPKKGTRIAEQIDTMFWNIWKQFGFKHGSKYTVTDYCWTTTTRKEFYSIPFHAKLLKLLEKRQLRISWLIDCEPLENNNIKQK